MKIFTTIRAQRTALQLFIALTPLWGAGGLFAQTSYTWNGSSNTSWTTSANWTPSGVPGTADYVTIVSATNAPVLTADRTVGRFKINSGTMDLAGYTLTVTDKVELLGGTTTAGKILQSASNIANINNATVNCKLDLTATTVTFQYATCTDSVQVHQTTTSSTISWRGNRFYGHLDLENTSNGNMNLGYNPADSCFDGLTVRGRRIRVAYAHPGYYVEGDVHVHDEGPTGTSIGLAGGNGTATITVDGNIIVDKTDLGDLNFAVTSGTCQMVQTAGHGITDGETGYTDGFFKIMGLTQGVGGSITLAAGADAQDFYLDQGTYGPSVGALTLDLNQVTIDGAEVNSFAQVEAKHIAVFNNRFAGATALTKTGSIIDTVAGNVFLSDLTLTNAAPSTAWRISLGGNDTVYGDLNATSLYHNLVLAFDSRTVVHGNLTCDNQGPGELRLGNGGTSGRLVMAGSGNQWIRVGADAEVEGRRLTIDKPSGRVLLSDTLQLTNAIYLVDGILECTDGGMLRLLDGAQALTPSDDSYIEGPVQKVGNDAFTFPIGKAGSYKPLTIGAPGSLTDVFKAHYVAGNSDPIHDHSLRDGSLSYMSENEYWVLTRDVGSSNVSVSLNWDTLTSCRIVSPLSGLHVAGWDGSNWDDLGNASTSGTIYEGSVKTATLPTVFNMFTLAHNSPMDCCAHIPTISQTGSLSPCEDDSSGIVTLWGSHGYEDYIWTLADGDTFDLGGKIQVNDLQVYHLSRPVCPDTTSYVVTTPTALHLVVTPQVTPSGFNLSCYHANDGVVQVTLGGGTPPYLMDYTYNGQPFPPNFAQLGAGTYTLNVTDQTGCTVADTAELFAPEQPLALGFAGEDVTITAGEAVELGADYFAGYEYYWYPETGLSDPHVANPVAYPTDTTMYVLTVGTQDTCVSKDTVYVNVLPWEPSPLDSSDIVFIDSIPSHVAGEMIVKFKPEMLKMERVDNVGIQKGALSLFLTDSIINLMRLAYYGQSHDEPSVMNDWGIRKIFRRLTSTDTTSISRLGEEVPIPDFWATFTLTLPGAVNEMEAIDSLNTLAPTVRYAEPNHVGRLSSLPNDPILQADEQESLIGSTTYPDAHVNMESAWEIEVGQEYVRVGVFDSSVMWNHEDFGDGTPSGTKVVGGYDYYWDLPIHEFTANWSHGTSCAGIIGALRNNEIGISGIAGGDFGEGNTGADLYSFGIFALLFLEPMDVVVGAIEIGARGEVNGGYGLHIQNHSWHSPFLNNTLGSVIKYAYINHCTIVASRGNFPNSSPEGNSPMDLLYPACFNNDWVISVGASGPDGRYKSYSNGDVGVYVPPYYNEGYLWQSYYSGGLDVIAPGTTDIVASTIVSTVEEFFSCSVEEDHYSCFGGTSASAPHVSGVTALLYSHHNLNNLDFEYPNNLAPEDVEQIIERTATDISGGAESYPVGYDEHNGWGRLNAGAALEQVHGPAYRVIHFSSIGTEPVENVDYDQNVTIDAFGGLSGLPSGYLYVADRHTLTWSLSHEFTNDEDIIGFWSRNSSSQGFSSATTITGETEISFDEDISGNSIMIEAVAHCWHITQDENENEVDIWIPAPPNRLKAAYSLHVRNNLYVSVAEPESNEVFDFTITPNPASDYISISGHLKESAPIQIEIYDATGKTAKKINFGTQQYGYFDIKMDAAEFDSGLYYFRLGVAGQWFVKPLVLIPSNP